MISGKFIPTELKKVSVVLTKLLESTMTGRDKIERCQSTMDPWSDLTESSREQKNKSSSTIHSQDSTKVLKNTQTSMMISMILDSWSTITGKDSSHSNHKRELLLEKQISSHLKIMIRSYTSTMYKENPCSPTLLIPMPRLSITGLMKSTCGHSSWLVTTNMSSETPT